jgi:multidrug efflux pump subunit AcrB
MENLVREVAGENYNYAWTGEAYQETQSGTTISLVLAAQYESRTDSVAVIMAMPTALLGTVMGCIFLSQSISIYTQIGIILLLGLAAKNAILIYYCPLNFFRF